jgi:hypothetical protein
MTAASSSRPRFSGRMTLTEQVLDALGKEIVLGHSDGRTSRSATA